MTEVDAKKIRSDYAKMIREKSKAAKETREKICREYQRYLKEDMPEADARKLLAERFDKNEKGIQRALERRADIGSPQSAAITEGLILSNLFKSYEDIQVAYDDCEHELTTIDHAISEGHTMIDVEETEMTSDKGDSKTVKRIPVMEARRRVEDRKLDLYDRFIKQVRDVTQKQKLVEVNFNNTINQLDDEDLDKQLLALDTSKKIEVKIVQDGGEN